MAPKRKLIPPLRPNADGTGFVRVGASTTVGGPRRTATQEEGDSAARGSRQERSCRDGHSTAQSGRPAEPRRGNRKAPGGRGRTPSSASSQLSSAASSPSSAPDRSSVSAGPCGPSAHAALLKSEARAPKPDNRRKGPAATLAPRQEDKATAPTDRQTHGFTEPSLTMDSSLGANECRASPSLLKQLCVGSGAVLDVVCADVVTDSAAPHAYLEVMLSTSCGRDTLVVAPETKSFLLGTGTDKSGLPVNQKSGLRVRATPVDGLSSLPHLHSITFDVQIDTEAALVPSSSGNDAPAGDECLAWQSLFRRAFRNRVVYAGMRAALRAPSAHTVVFEVTDITSAESTRRPPSATAASCGIVTGTTSLVLSGAPASGAADHQGVEGTAAEEGTGGTLKGAAQGHAAMHTLYVGDTGTGKSFQLQRQASETEARGTETVFVIRVEDLPQGEGSEVATATALREVFAAAKHACPSTVFLDDLHLLCGGSGTSSSVASSWAFTFLAATLCEELRDIASRGVPVRLVASATSREALEPSLRATDRLGGHVVQLAAPSTAAERVAVLHSCLSALGRDSADLDEAVEEVARHGHGYTQRDLRRVVEMAAMDSFQRRGTPSFDKADLLSAAKQVHPSSLRQFEVSIPDVTWDDIGGSETAKRTLQEVVAWCLGKQSWVFTEFNLSPPKGVLLYGPPGCSKTMLAKALANESRMNFVSVKGPEVFSKWVGDSEKAVRDIFARARAAAPCVVFIDELDGMCGHRGRGGVSDRVISQFLTELDGLPSAMQEEGAKDKQRNALVFVAATNRPDNIDGAVLRPGRIDRRVHVGLPELAEREAIVRIQFKKIPTEEGLTPAFVAERTSGYTGAEVVAVVKEAAFTAIAEDVAARCVTAAHVERALTKVRPRVDPKDVLWYKQWPHVNSLVAGGL